VLHTTIIGSDDDIALISSGNLDLRSLELDLQVRLVC
jgi:phosphatidylserine/phosphatidylglycerophosphate/cardiolipin synthase-like enzyme